MDKRGDWDIVSGLGITALWAAAGRVMESKRRDALIDDRYAEGFITRAATATPMSTIWASMIGSRDWSETDEQWADIWAAIVDYVGVRLRFFDEYCLDTCAAGVRQLVILAAGLDTRAFRLSWPPHVDLFELDMPKVLEFKDSVLVEQGAVATCIRYAVPIDLRADWPNDLLRADFDPRRATAWLAEGLLGYLPGTAVEALFANVQRLSAPGSRLATQMGNPAQLALRRDSELLNFLHELGVNIAASPPGDKRPDAERWFRDRDWQVTTTSIAQAADQYRRRLDEFTAARFGGSILFTARCG